MKWAGVRFLSGVFSRCESVSGIIDGSNGNTFNSTGSKQSLAESKSKCGDMFRFPGGLGKIDNLPPHRIPTKFRQSDIFALHI